MDRRSSSKPAEPFAPQYPLPDWAGFLKLGSSRKVHRVFLGFHPRKRLFGCFLVLVLGLICFFGVGHLEIVVLFPVCFVDIFNFVFILFFLFFLFFLFILFLTWL